MWAATHLWNAMLGCHNKMVPFSCSALIWVLKGMDNIIIISNLAMFLSSCLCKNLTKTTFHSCFRFFESGGSCKDDSSSKELYWRAPRAGQLCRTGSERWSSRRSHRTSADDAEGGSGEIRRSEGGRRRRTVWYSLQNTRRYALPKACVCETKDCCVCMFNLLFFPCNWPNQSASTSWLVTLNNQLVRTIAKAMNFERPMLCVCACVWLHVCTRVRVCVCVCVWVFFFIRRGFMHSCRCVALLRRVCECV